MATKTELRDRWRDDALVDRARGFLMQLTREPLATTVDLRGASLGDRLPGLTLINGTFANIDISQGKGPVVANRATVTALAANGFHFDRASFFLRSEVSESSFEDSRGRYEAEGTRFIRCSFQRSQFRGGFNEYGFRRCRFVECTFDGMDWKNTYLRACEFHNCRFGNARVTDSIVTAAKFFGNSDWQPLFEGSRVESIFIEGERAVQRKIAVQLGAEADFGPASDTLTCTSLAWAEAAQLETLGV